jgi:hypothetical protein
MGWHDIRLSEVASQLKTDYRGGAHFGDGEATCQKNTGRNRYEPALQPKKHSLLKARCARGCCFCRGCGFLCDCRSKVAPGGSCGGYHVGRFGFSFAGNERIRRTRAQLAGSVRRRATVIRDGRRLEVFSEVLVPGDLIVVTARCDSRRCAVGLGIGAVL